MSKKKFKATGIVTQMDTKSDVIRATMHEGWMGKKFPIKIFVGDRKEFLQMEKELGALIDTSKIGNAEQRVKGIPHRYEIEIKIIEK